jgi:hypothetical protein
MTMALVLVTATMRQKSCTVAGSGPCMVVKKRQQELKRFTLSQSCADDGQADKEKTRDDDGTHCTATG